MEKKEKIARDGSYVVKKSRKANVFAYILCVLIALIIWLYVANRDEMRGVEAPPQGDPAYTTTA